MQAHNRHFLVAVQHICHLSTRCLNYGKYNLHINIVLLFSPRRNIYLASPHSTHPWKHFPCMSQFWLTPISARVFTCISPQSILMLSLPCLVKKKKKKSLPPSIKSRHHALRRRHLNELRFRRRGLHVFAAKEVRFLYTMDATAPTVAVLGSRAELKQISQVAHKKRRAILSYSSANVVSFGGLFSSTDKSQNAKCDGDVKALWNCLLDAFGCNGRINIMQRGK